MLKTLINLSISAVDNVVLGYIKSNPGQRLFEIDKATINSHHQWGSKYIVHRLEERGKIYVQRQRMGERIAPRYYAV